MEPLCLEILIFVYNGSFWPQNCLWEASIPIKVTFVFKSPSFILFSLLSHFLGGSNCIIAKVSIHLTTKNFNPKHRSRRSVMDIPEMNPNAQPPRRQQIDPTKYLVPLVWVPALPLIRHAFSHNPRLRDRVFLAGVFGALAHAGYVMFSESTVWEFGTGPYFSTGMW